jgi:hypothetical protein
MKTRRLILALMGTVLTSALSFVPTAHAQATSVAKIKHGDTIKISFSRYDTRGREIYAASTELMDSQVSATDKNYTWSSPLGVSTHARETHAMLERTTPDGKKEIVPEKEQFKWFPVGGDFSKLLPGEAVIRNTQCGEGTFKYTSSSQAAKFKLMVAGKEQELDVQDVTLKGRWNFPRCGSGDQVMRFVYSPQLDFIVERDLKSFLPNGFLSSGNVYKITAVN